MSKEISFKNIIVDGTLPVGPMVRKYRINVSFESDGNYSIFVEIFDKGADKYTMINSEVYCMSEMVEKIFPDNKIFLGQGSLFHRFKGIDEPSVFHVRSDDCSSFILVDDDEETITNLTRKE